jgi:hypothetical protein
MNKYVVKVSSIFSNIIEVDAEDEDMARIKAKDYLESIDDQESPEKLRHYYESTFPPENWPVITQEKYNELKEQVKSEIEGGKAAADIA